MDRFAEEPFCELLSLQSHLPVPFRLYWEVVSLRTLESEADFKFASEYYFLCIGQETLGAVCTSNVIAAWT